MIGTLLKLFGALVLALILCGGLFTAGARYGARSALEAVASRVAKARAARAEPPKLGAVPKAPDPSIIASPADQDHREQPAPKSGTIRRYEGDKLVSEEPVEKAIPQAAAQTRTAQPERP